MESPSKCVLAALPWLALLIPLVGGVAAIAALDEPVALGTFAVRPAPYAIGGEVFGLTTTGLVALNGRNPPRRVAGDVPADATDLAIDPAQRVYWATVSVVHEVDLLTGSSDSVDVGAPIVDSIVLCRGLVGLTSTGLVQWSPGGPPSLALLSESLQGVAFGSDCDHVTAWNAEGFGSAAIVTGAYERRVAWSNPIAAQRDGRGWLVADAVGVAQLAPDGTVQSHWSLPNVTSLCGVVADRVCAVTSDGVVWSLP